MPDLLLHMHMPLGRAGQQGWRWPAGHQPHGCTHTAQTQFRFTVNPLQQLLLEWRDSKAGAGQLAINLMAAHTPHRHNLGSQSTRQDKYC